MAAPPDTSHIILPAKSFQTSAGENLATVPSPNGSPHGSVNNGDTVPPPNPASSVTGNLTDKGQTSASSDQPASTNPADPVTSPNLPDTQPRGIRKNPQAPSENDKTEETSTAHTLTQKGTLPSRQKANGSPNSEPAHARVNGHGKQHNTTKRKKVSFISKIVHILVPCITPKSHSIEVDTPTSIPKESQTPKPESEKVEVAAPEAPSKSSEPQLSAPKDPQETVLDETGLALTPVTPKEGTPDNADVIVPPTPTTRASPVSETIGVTSRAVVQPGAVGPANEKQNRISYVPSSVGPDGEESDSYTDDEIDDLPDEDTDEELLNGGAGIPVGPDGVPRPLLPPIAPQHVGRKCLILDLDETLVHSSFKSFQQADYVVPVEIEYHWHNVYVIKRPGVDNFLKKMGEIYEIVVFTASLSKYADPVLDKLDVHRVVSHRLFRESCYNHKGNYVKDLSQLGRPIADTIILDNSPASYIFHPNNAVPVSSWFNDPHDTELTDLVPFLADLSTVDDVRGVLDGAR